MEYASSAALNAWSFRIARPYGLITPGKGKVHSMAFSGRVDSRNRGFATGIENDRSSLDYFVKRVSTVSLN